MANAAAHADAPARPHQDLLAQGSLDERTDRSDWVWVARVVPSAASPGEATTTVYVRKSGGSQWAELARGLGGRAVSIASRGEQVALLLDNGEWVIVSIDPSAGLSSGRPLNVNGGAIVALSNDRATYWAAARLPGGIAALPEALSDQPAGTPATPGTAATTAPAPSVTTRPTTATNPSVASATTGPSIMSAPLADTLSILRLGSSGWVGVSDIPRDFAGPNSDFTFALVEDVPWLAVRTGKGLVRLYHLVTANEAAGAPLPTTTAAIAAPATSRSSTPRWASVATAKISESTGSIKLLTGAPSPVLWASGPFGAADEVFIFGRDGTSRRVTLDGTKESGATMRAAAYAAGAIRAVYASSTGALFEQSFDHQTGQAAVAAAPIVLPKSEPLIWEAFRGMIIVGAMVYAMTASYSRRESIREVKLESITFKLAPLPVRALAGVIDALPVLAAMLFQAWRVGSGAASGFDMVGELVFWLMVLVYVAHTAITEIMTGRSLGKMIFGLRVVGLDGTPATRNQVLTRNALRVIDAGLMFLPLVLVPFSPLQQRAGDAAAGTLVVTKADPNTATDTPEPGSPA